MEKWKPINWRGTWSHDPRDELRRRAQVARANYDDYVAIPVKLAMAVADLRECGATTDLKVDYKDEPLQLRCRQPEGHYPVTRHFNGSITWVE